MPRSKKKVVEQKPPEVGLVGTVNARENHKVEFEFKIGEKPDALKSHQVFVRLTPEQLELMKEYRSRASEAIVPTYAHLERNTLAKKFKWLGLYPFGVDTNKWAREVNAPERKGIATLIHYAIAGYLANRYSAYSIRHNEMLPTERRLQIEHMGIDPKREYRLQEYWQIVKRHTEEKFPHVASC